MDYELFDPLPGEGTRSFRGRQLPSGTEVVVHLLLGGRTPENERLLGRLRGIPAPSFSRLIELGENEGTPFVVTAAPPYLHLAEWLAEQERGAMPVAPAAPAAPAAKEPGEFTRLFQAGGSQPAAK